MCYQQRREEEHKLTSLFSLSQCETCIQALTKPCQGRKEGRHCHPFTPATVTLRARARQLLASDLLLALRVLTLICLLSTSLTGKILPVFQGPPLLGILPGLPSVHVQTTSLDPTYSLLGVMFRPSILDLSNSRTQKSAQEMSVKTHLLLGHGSRTEC